MPLVPTVLWAQRKDKLYLTLDIQDAKAEKLTLENVDGCGKLTFKGKGGTEQQDYELDLVFNKEVDASASKLTTTPRCIFCVIAKTEQGHWPRLTKDSGRHLSHVKCDWNKWVDEDEEDEATDNFMNQFSDFSGFGGGEGFGGDEEAGEDSDDGEDELPDLVK